jgi:hypothetical protein
LKRYNSSTSTWEVIATLNTGALADLDTIDTSYLTDAGALATLDSIDTSYVTDAGDLATVNADALVYFSSTAPVNPASNPLWGDTSVTPYKLKRWNGTGWDIIATLNTGALADVDAADWSTQITGTGKPADNADVTQTALDLGAAIDNATANGATLISGGYIQTSLLDVDDIIVNGAILVTGDGTSNLTDDAGLGSTATWANVSGTGKPADNADVTAKHTANDTTYVNGTAASTVKNNAATGATHAGTAHAPSNADKTTATVIGNAMDGTAVITTGIIKDSAENMVIDFDAATIEINSTYGLLVNSSDGIKIDSGGSIVFLGRNDDPGSLVFTGSSGSTASGVDASGAFLCFWPSLAATNNGFAVGYRPTFDGNVSETSFDYISFSGAFSTTLIGNNKELRITGSGTESVGNIFPSTTNMYSLGSSYTAWAAIYGDAIYRNGSALDVYDDLYELSQVKSKKEKNEFGEKTEVEKVNAKGLPVIDPLSIPQELTNYDDVVATLKHDNCDLITQEDIDEYILDDEEAGWMLKTDFTLLSDLTMGAVRQLDSEVISMFELLSNRITKLENTLGGTKNAN